MPTDYAPGAYTGLYRSLLTAVRVATLRNRVYCPLGKGNAIRSRMTRQYPGDDTAKLPVRTDIGALDVVAAAEADAPRERSELRDLADDHVDRDRQVVLVVGLQVVGGLDLLVD